MTHNPYQPPSPEDRDQHVPETDWSGLMFVIVVLSVIFFREPLVNFFAYIFRNVG